MTFPLSLVPQKSALWKPWSGMVVRTALREKEDPRFKVTLGSRGRPYINEFKVSPVYTASFTIA